MDRGAASELILPAHPPFAEIGRLLETEFEAVRLFDVAEVAGNLKYAGWSSEPRRPKKQFSGGANYPTRTDFRLHVRQPRSTVGAESYPSHSGHPS